MEIQGNLMRPIRFRINRLMIIIAVIAFNLGVFRILVLTRHIDIVLGGGFVWAMLAIGTYRAIRNHNQRRPFWLGFVGFGAIATSSLVAATYFPQPVAGLAWEGYLIQFDGVIQRIVGALFLTNKYQLAHELFVLAMSVLVWILPIVFVAVLGGFVASWLVDRLVQCQP